MNEKFCSQDLRAEGKPYPRTCQKCGLGPCQKPVPSTPQSEQGGAQQDTCKPGGCQSIGCEGGFYCFNEDGSRRTVKQPDWDALSALVKTPTEPQTDQNAEILRLHTEMAGLRLALDRANARADRAVALSNHLQDQLSGQRTSVVEDAERFVFMVECALADLRGDDLTSRQQALHASLENRRPNTLEDVRACIDEARSAAQTPPIGNCR